MKRSVKIITMILGVLIFLPGLNKFFEPAHTKFMDQIVSIIVQSDQGITGCTYATWKYGSDDTLLVATDGDWFSSIKSDVVPAKIVQIK